MAYIRFEEDGIVTAVSAVEVDGFLEIPVEASEIESILLNEGKILRYHNGDLRVEENPRYWKNKFHDAVLHATKPRVLEFSYGEIIRIPIEDLNIIVAYSVGDAMRNRSYCDSNGFHHMLSTYEWKNVVESATEILSQLAQIQSMILSLDVDSESRYTSMCNTLKHRVNAAYERS